MSLDGLLKEIYAWSMIVWADVTCVFAEYIAPYKSFCYVDNFVLFVEIYTIVFFFLLRSCFEYNIGSLWSSKEVGKGRLEAGVDQTCRKYEFSLLSNATCVLGKIHTNLVLKTSYYSIPRLRIKLTIITSNFH